MSGAKKLNEGDEVTRKHFMTSTWHKDPSKHHPLKNFLAHIAYQSMYKGPDPGIRTGKVGSYSVIEQHMLLMPLCLAPMAAQYISMRFFNFTWHPVLAYLVYSKWLLIAMMPIVGRINSMALKHGFLDGGVPRDQVPDSRLNSTVFFLLATISLRSALSCFAAYKQDQLPFLSPWLPVHMFMYSVILDFYFYVYHRAMHEVPSLWRFHRVHHLTKHPSPLLSAFADPEQDMFDILVIPLLTWMTYRVDFFSWWIISVYILSIEAAGHSGVRVQWRSPMNYPILNWFGMDLALEDHDLHHRNGWRKSGNYGKQSRVWDKLFGTAQERIEFREENCL